LDDPEVIREAKAQRNYIYAFFILYVAGANLAIYLGSLIFAAIAGIPYGLYVFFFKRVAINTLGYVICTIIGSILAFFMLFLLAWTSDPSVPH
jgi:ABC-type proline/glycine betaine transport system permease subunit